LAQFSYIHLSDTHLCVQNRRNVLHLLQRDLHNRLDTAFQQARSLGLGSFLRPASYAPEIVAGVAQFCFERAAVVDGLIVTGDLATTGIATDVNAALRFVASPAAAGFYSAPRSPTLGFVDGRVIQIIPGNHDKFDDDLGSPNGRNFELRFSSYIPNFSSGVGHWIDEKQGKRLAFVLADFALLSRLDATDPMAGVFGQGRVYQTVLDELRDRTLLLRRRTPDISVVWIIHFAPYDCGHTIKLLDFNRFVDAAVSLRIVATLCGHTHRSLKVVVDHHTIYCGGSAGCVDKEHDARIHWVRFDVAKECRRRRDNYVWDRAQHEFVHHSTD
jgi:3',5'-cyclic AMP phosphodiesterase CpdA